MIYAGKVLENTKSFAGLEFFLFYCSLENGDLIVDVIFQIIRYH